jgi:hypothetical protein
MNDLDDRVATETERVRRIQDKEAPRYDRQMGFFERVLFGGGGNVSVRFGAGHLVREPLDYLADVGFEIESVERSKWGIVERALAHKPG